MATTTEAPKAAPTPTIEYVRDGSIVGGHLYDDQNKIIERDHYLKKDMPVAAVFESFKKAPLIHLIPFRHEHGINGETRRIDGSGLRVQFRYYGVQIWNSKILEMMLDPQRGLLNNDLGYRIDPLDPTGFWRQNGLIEIEMIPTYKAGTPITPSFEKLNLTPTIPKNLVILQPVKVG